MFYAFDLPEALSPWPASYSWPGWVPFFTSWVVIIPLSLYRYLAAGAEEAAVLFFIVSQVLSIPFVVVCLTLAIRN
ncbi:MAG: hypothetical protein MZV70_36485, partial [Desulfobacterales bacterium]|nr:hypothetical protein [Desulfobacterales bacterium]